MHADATIVIIMQACIVMMISYAAAELLLAISLYSLLTMATMLLYAALGLASTHPADLESNVTCGMFVRGDASFPQHP